MFVSFSLFLLSLNRMCRRGQNRAEAGGDEGGESSGGRQQNPPPVGTPQAPVDAGQLMIAVNTLISVVMQQNQQMQADMRAIQANAEAWRQET